MSLDAGAFAARLARRASGLLAEFNHAGVLTAADVHVALRIGRLGGTDDEDTLLAAAFAVRAPRLGHVCVDLATIRTTASTDLEVPVDLQELRWPKEDEWIGRLGESPLVGTDRPLHLEGTTLYLDRFWSEERQVAADLLALAEPAAEGVDARLLAAGLKRLFPATGGPEDERPGEPDYQSPAEPDYQSPAEPDYQRLAAASAVLRKFSLIAGGPGTGKTTTVARVLALLDEQAAAGGRRPPLVALAAPTGKAAARLEEAVHSEAKRVSLEAAERARLGQLRGTTLHRLLGFDPGNRSRFRHHRLNRLAHDVVVDDVVVVDETSMVSLSLMARLVEAVRSDARLILVGDPEQLASVEAGAVLGDIVGPAARGMRMRLQARESLAAAAGQAVPASDPESGSPIGDGTVVLRHVHRFEGRIGELAEAIQAGDAARAVSLLDGGDPDVCWIPTALAADRVEAPKSLEALRAAAVESGLRVVQSARDGRAAEAIEALSGFRLLCAHRRGPEGVSTWAATVESWLAAAIPEFGSEGTWYAGRPLLVTENDYALQLYNGDTGVVVMSGSGRLVAAFERGTGVIEVSPTRLASVDTVYAMTIHKAQGSQFGAVAVLLPGPDSPILTRELLYTAVTRARRKLFVVGTEESVRAAVDRPIARASGLRAALWGD